MGIPTPKVFNLKAFNPKNLVCQNKDCFSIDELEILSLPDYLVYLEPRSAEVIAVRCLLIEREEASLQALEVQALLWKMLAAINIGRAECALVRCELTDFKKQIRGYQACVMLAFDPIFRGLNKGLFILPHPSNILVDSRLKRQAWQVLQEAEVWLKT